MSSSSSSAVADPMQLDVQEQEQGFKEYKVMSSFRESSKYYNAVFPYAKPSSLQDGTTLPMMAHSSSKAGKSKKKKREPSKAEKQAIGKYYPPFGTKTFPAPVRLYTEEIGTEIASEEKDRSEEEELELDGNPFRRRRQYKPRRETRWMLCDARKENVFVGESEAQGAKYFVMIPPQEETGEEFKMVPVHEWIKFQRQAPKKTTSQEIKELAVAEKANERSINEGDSLGRLRKRFLGDDNEENEDSKGFELADDNDDGLLMEGDDEEIQKKATLRGRGVGLEEDEDEEDEAERIDVLAIDVQGGKTGEAGADYDQEFDDDDDDHDVFEEEDGAGNNPDEGGEEIEEAFDQDSDDSEDEVGAEENHQEDDDEEMGDEGANESMERRPSLDRAESVDEKAKIEIEDDEDMDDLEKPDSKKRKRDGIGEEKQPKRQKTGVEAFKEMVIEIMRQAGGTMLIDQVYKVAIRKDKLRSVGMKRKDAKQQLAGIVKQVADIEENRIDETMHAKLKAEYL